MLRECEVSCLYRTFSDAVFESPLYIGKKLKGILFDDLKIMDNFLLK
ncbi:hypothetical protein [Borrelia turicatae]|nr:hypothetical protein [Borrelia turicatae]UPA14257.1 hypothetical protein bt91E135_001434 [Borrelia turicatae 91E135]